MRTDTLLSSSDHLHTKTEPSCMPVSVYPRAEGLLESSAGVASMKATLRAVCLVVSYLYM